MFMLDPLNNEPVTVAPEVLDTVRQAHEALIAEGKFPAIKAIHIFLNPPNRKQFKYSRSVTLYTTRVIRAARQILLEEGSIVLPAAKNGHHKPVTVLSPPKPKLDPIDSVNQLACMEKDGPCWKEIRDYRQAWQRIRKGPGVPLVELADGEPLSSPSERTDASCAIVGDSGGVAF